jgi:hypothetical protein
VQEELGAHGELCTVLTMKRKNLTQFKSIDDSCRTEEELDRR